MDSPQKKLSDVFNAHAGKVVEGREFEALFKEILRERLTPDEVSQFMALSQLDPSGLFDDKERTQELVEKIGDGSFGVYSGRGSIYFNTHFLEFAMDIRHVPPAIADKVIDAFAEILDTAPDYRDKVKTGALRPLPRKNGLF